jgi:hypothetical protein
MVPKITSLCAGTGFGKDQGRETSIVWRDRGGFDTPAEAACAYDDAAIRLYGEFAWPNSVLVETPLAIWVPRSTTAK